jgi:DNA-binding YbaB/EbfC family protein
MSNFKMPGIGDMMEKVKQMQEDMKAAEAKIDKMQETGESGAGLVKATINGHFECVKIELDKELLTEEVGIIEDLILSAFNKAVKKIDDAKKDSMSNIKDGIKLPIGLEDFLK